ncbi:hypothetical protein V2J09_014198 [Rumex salicifolius]
MEIKGERKQWTQICVLLGFLLSCYSVRQSSALSITVDSIECVYEYVLYDGDAISGNFVVDDSHMYWISEHRGITFTVTSPDGVIVHNLNGSSGDKFDFKAPRSGMYQFCFHNPSSSPNTLSFHIHVGHIPTEHGLAKDEHLDPINVKIAQLREALESVTGEQKYLKARDARHRHTNESTRKRLIVYTVLEYLLLVVASGVQVLIIHRLFGKSVGYNRV